MQINFCEFTSKPRNSRKASKESLVVCLRFRYNGTVNFHPVFLDLFATLYRRCKRTLKQILSYSESGSKGKRKTSSENEKIPIKAA